MNVDVSTLTLAAVLTTAGSTAAAALIVGLVALLKSAGVPAISGNEPKIVLAIALVLVVVAALAAFEKGGTKLDLEFAFAAFIAWYAISRLAMSLYDDLTNKPASLRAQV